ncbi:MAG TPA: type I-MYXAN CRISPR-associated protein Cmx8 [Pirellulales bacterium]|nr:type I-MYXAN CRISPR-associated protein Cmx8 [Pirellulales bacterium]
MAKRATRPKSENAAITLSFDLLELPTSQHKAGLAGLVLLIQSLPDKDAAPKIEDLTPTSARIRFTKDSLQALFDDLYDARIVEVESASKWQGQSPKGEKVVEETDPKNGRVRTRKSYLYDVVQPAGRFLYENLADNCDAWHKLWRDMLWAIPRGKPTTRTPFNERADGKPCAEGGKMWRELEAFDKARSENRLRTCEIAGAILLGAQAVNAEGVAFQGRSDQTLLLHFWQITALTFVPQAVDQDGQGEFAGYVLAIPEVADLIEFTRLFPRMLRQLSEKRYGYRPAGAVVDLPEQGALEFFRNLGRLSAQRVAGKEVSRYATNAVEFFQMAKLGNNVKTMASGRVVLENGLIEQYDAVLAVYRNPLFRSAVVLALLQGEPWYLPMGDALMKRPWQFFVKCDETPRGLSWFSADAAAKFKRVFENDQLEKEESSMNPEEVRVRDGAKLGASLESIVYRVVQNFVRRKTEEKSGCRYEDFKDKTFTDEKTGKTRMAVPEPYSAAKQKICSGAFLAFRSRRDSDFVDYFTSTIGQVAQFLPPEDYRVLAEALLRTEGPLNRDDVKTLAMLAISAAS